MTANAGASGWPRNGGLTTSEISPYGPGVLAPRGRSMTTASVAGLEIRVLHEPTVYLVGRQTVDQAELERFLADHGVAWQTDTEVAGECLTEIAGRLCYMSFARPRPGGNSAYLNHIREVGHGSVLEHAVWNFV